MGNLHRERISRTIVIQWSGNIHICTKCMHRTSTQTWRKNSCPYKTFHLVIQSCKMGWRDCIIWVMLVWNSFFLVEEGYPLVRQEWFYWIGRWDFHLVILFYLKNQPSTAKKGFTLLFWLLDSDYEIDFQFSYGGKEK